MPYSDYEKQKANARKYYHENREKCKQVVRAHWAANKETLGEQAKRKRAEAKKALFNLLGNKCVRCGFEDSRILQVDHIRGDGFLDRPKKATRRRGAGNHAKMLRDPSLFESYQLLCPNCNWLKRIENGEYEGGDAYLRIKETLLEV